MVTFSPSNYKFTDPIRYFKANDPYYYEVDNIPLKQLQENCNFLKDQFEALSLEVEDFDRSKFAELKPYSVDQTNIVKVKPGRFTARVNDGYNLSPLQILERIGGINAEFFTESITDYNYKTNIDETIKETLDKFKEKLAANSTDMNGLYERLFTWSMVTPNTSEDIESTLNIRENGRLVAYDTGLVSSITQGINSRFLQNEGLAWASVIENEFIKKWRGIARTSIVDVKEELEIEIPAFNSQEFFYIDSDGEKQYLNADHRIDLLFIYSKPIDVASTTIAKFDSLGQPITITQPALGIVKGAGIGVNLKNNPLASNTAFNTRIVDDDGNPLILPNVSDELSENTGFLNVKGSFPSPDDLMNLTPLISEDLESSDIRLIGQSILPIAYIVVRNEAESNIYGVPIITNSDIIDIRPFFRTAELSYNERAGIAAATPPISLANPVVTQNYVQGITKKLSDLSINNQTSIVNLRDRVERTPRVIGAGTVKGGWYFGVESTLFDFVSQNLAAFNLPPGSTKSQIKNVIKDRFGYYQSDINNYPDWDLRPANVNTGPSNNPTYNHRRPGAYYHLATSMKSPIQTLTASGEQLVRLNDRIPSSGETTEGNNFAQYGWGNPNITDYDELGWAPGTASTSRFTNINAVAPFRSFHSNGTYNQDAGGKYTFRYLSKTITIEGGLPPGFVDFDVNIRFLNCAPLTQADNVKFPSQNDYKLEYLFSKGAGIGGNTWITKGKDANGNFQFTIFVAFGGQDPDLGGVYTGDVPKVANSGGTYFVGNAFAVIVPSMLNIRDTGLDYEVASRVNRTFDPQTQSVAGSVVGCAAMPSISFEVIGYPENSAYSNHNLSNRNGGSTIVVS